VRQRRDGGRGCRGAGGGAGDGGGLKFRNLAEQFFKIHATKKKKKKKNWFHNAKGCAGNEGGPWEKQQV
jgi:hypothetical protein